MSERKETGTTRHSPPRFSCYSCHQSTAVRCNLGRDGYPQVGSNCSAFLYEPGTDEREREDFNEM